MMREAPQVPKLLAALVAVSLTSVAVGKGPLQNPDASGIQPVLNLDAAVFAGENPDSARLEVYYQVFHFGLQFQRDDARFRADYALTVAVDDDDGRVVGLQERDRSVVVPDHAHTVSRFDYRTGQINFDVPSGDYLVRCVVQDQGSKVYYRAEKKIKVRKFDRNRPKVSDVEFVEAVTADPADSGSVFRKGNLTVIPSVNRGYGGSDSSKLLYYTELYSGKKPDDGFVIESILRNPKGTMVYRDTLHLALADPVHRQLHQIGIGTFAPGEYELEVALKTLRNKVLDYRQDKFIILWSQDNLLRHDFAAAIQQLRLIASPAEVERIEDAKTSEERIEAFNAFWLERDPTVGTAENESKQEFYRRVNYANREFRYLRRDGWKTDRGRIYIIHGEPDQIDDYPMSMSYPPYQIWHYYKSGLYRRFAFLDEDHDGEYKLQYPYDGLNQTPDF